MGDTKRNDERSQTTPEDPVRDFAQDLRRLRLDAGSPTLPRLQQETGISRTVLSEAFSGRTLPSERTVAALVPVLDADPAPFLARRDLLARALREEAPPAPADEGRPPVTLARRTAVLLSVATFAAGSLATLGGVAAVTALTQPRYGEPQITVEDGVDPATTPCVDDAAVATGDTRADDSLLEIVWSDKCQAGWGRITRYDARSAGNTVTIAIYPKTAPDGPLRQEATEHDVQSAYTTLVVRPSPDTLLCAEGSFTVDGKRIDLGDPLCI